MAKKKNLNTAPATPYTRKEKYLSVMAGVTDLDTLPTNPQNREERYLDAIANKPGGGSYTAGDGIKIDENNEISVDTETIQPKLTAGTNITIDADNVISANGGGGSLYWHTVIIHNTLSGNAGYVCIVIINQTPDLFTLATLKEQINSGGLYIATGNIESYSCIYVTKCEPAIEDDYSYIYCTRYSGNLVVYNIRWSDGTSNIEAQDVTLI